MIHGVFVGIDRYRDPAIPTLRYARHDAESLHRLFDVIEPQERSTRLLVDEEATRANIHEAIANSLPRRMESNDSVVLYFAGHGSPECSGVLEPPGYYLVPHDAQATQIVAQGIDMQRDVVAWFERLDKAGLVVLFLDCCFSGAAGSRSFLGPFLGSRPRQALYSTPLSIAQLDLGHGRVILCAATDGQAANEDARLGHGIFTYHLIRALSQERSEPAVTITELYEELDCAVASETEDAQQPVISMHKARRAKLPILALR